MKGEARNTSKNLKWRIIPMVLFFVIFQTDLVSQVQDTTSNMSGTRLTDEDIIRHMKKDTSNGSDLYFLEHSPRKALTYSLILPGLGQGYNKKYWKIPIVYGVLGGVGYWIYYNTYFYRLYSEEYALDQSENNERYVRFWRRNLELSYISLVGAYALQALDAYVDANLYYWDVGQELTIRLEPMMDPILNGPGNATMKYGLRCTVNF
ncbi:DUF5683 domain-containing protein [Bacteroidota bacterium]